jgi:hypothetical protein
MQAEGPRAVLLRAVQECDRLVLLGDVLEFRHGPEREAMASAREPLRELGRALGAGREVLIVPGNHDHRLLDAWLGRRSRREPPPPFGLDTQADMRRGEALATIGGWLSPATVRVFYPGVWLREDVYATHGHYGDLHLTIPTLERLAAGVMGRVIGLRDGRPSSIEDYEAALAPMYAWIEAVAQRVAPGRGRALHEGSMRGWVALTGNRGRGPRELALALGYPAAVAALNRAGIGPLQAELTGAALRRAGLRGLEEALRRLRVPAAYVLFGHTHRAGPLPGDDTAEWLTATGARLFNSGCWVNDPRIVGPEHPRSPYRPGFVVWLEASGAPQLVNLLDG